VKHHLFSTIVTSLLITLYLFSLPFSVLAQSADPVVRAILFYSPTCPHCAKVIQEDLPPLFERYGTQLEIVGIDASQLEGGTLYRATIERFQIPENRFGVPTLIIADTVLVGSLEIPEQLPGLVEYHLSQGGVDWPDIPGLSDTIAASMSGQPTDHTVEPPTTAPQSPTTEPVSSPQTPTATETLPATLPTPVPTQITSGLVLPDEHDLSWHEKFARDPAGNTLSVFVLLGMLGALVWVFLFFIREGNLSQSSKTHWLIPVLCLVGFFVAGYLAYVETAQVSAVCGPVGDCNTVQQSEYARLFGILPIGVLGLAGYVMILLAWLGARLGRNGVELSPVHFSRSTLHFWNPL